MGLLWKRDMKRLLRRGRHYSDTTQAAEGAISIGRRISRSGACHCAGVCWSTPDGQQGIPQRLWVFRWYPRIVAEYQSRHRCNVGSGFGVDGWPSRRSPGHEAVLEHSTIFTRTEGLCSRHVSGDVAGSPVRQTDGKNHLGASIQGAQILFAELLANH